MKNTAAHRTTAHGSTATPTAKVIALQQLTLLPDLLPDLAPAPNVHPRFLLSKNTRELGMRHVAEIRQVLAQRKATNEASVTRSMPARTHTDRAA